MKFLKPLLAAAVIAGFTVPATASANDELAKNVVSIMIENHSRLININLLSEICAIEKYLGVDASSDAFKKQLSKKIAQTAELTGVKNYNADKVSVMVTAQFQSFVNGVRYGGFIADNFIKSKNAKICTKEIKTTVIEGINTMQKEPLYRLEDDS
ncbi:hypothetical protein [Pleionea sp. CnH1-48]|uniref:hypothetical protein n=1 Tax=Pleionea sp. CnH1-48 TaxID=2954494 RepID=UPI002097CA9D|nr:hypothetical protein [Pleionea sp. CnH1-48]MCO7225956.1 hypothetical protein [Pleionea sp. CnH1-48]